MSDHVEHTSSSSSSTTRWVQKLNKTWKRQDEDNEETVRSSAGGAVARLLGPRKKCPAIAIARAFGATQLFPPYYRVSSFLRLEGERDVD